MKPLDLIGAFELAYDRSKGDEAWLDDLVATIAPAFTVGPATTAFFFDISAERPKVGHAASIGERPYTSAHYEQQHEFGEAVANSSARAVYDCDMFTLLSRVVGPDVAAQSIHAAGMNGDDALGLRANVSAESGIVFTTHVNRGYRIRNRALWTRFASHVGAALRVRRAAETPSPDSAAAVISPRGRIEHIDPGACGGLDTREAQGDLAAAAKDMDRARGKLRRLDADEASSLWRAMVRGEWSLVDWVDHDGKRFLLAHANHVPVDGRRNLTERERQVVACAAMGHSNKLIAYDLGLSTGTVAVLLGRAAKKLGVSGRVALIRAFKDQSAPP